MIQFAPARYCEKCRAFCAPGHCCCAFRVRALSWDREWTATYALTPADAARNYVALADMKEPTESYTAEIDVEVRVPLPGGEYATETYRVESGYVVEYSATRKE